MARHLSNYLTPWVIIWINAHHLSHYLNQFSSPESLSESMLVTWVIIWINVRHLSHYLNQCASPESLSESMLVTRVIIWINDGMLLIGPLGTNFCKIIIEIDNFPFKLSVAILSQPHCVKLGFIHPKLCLHHRRTTTKISSVSWGVCVWHCHPAIYDIERHTVHTIVSWPNPKQWVRDNMLPNDLWKWVRWIHPGNNYYSRVALLSTLSPIPRSCYGGHGNSLVFFRRGTVKQFGIIETYHCCRVGDFTALAWCRVSKLEDKFCTALESTWGMF